jgi:hypothetical protein
VATAALRGALTEIGRLGGGTVESYPEDASDRKVSGSFLYNATLAVFESHGFERVERLGKHHSIVRTVVAHRRRADQRSKRLARPATRPRRRLGEVLGDGAAAYATHGFAAEEWTRHHQGGPTGYVGRDPVATPGSSVQVVEDQAFAWNPSLPG